MTPSPQLHSRIYDALLGSTGTHMHVIGSSGSGKSKFLEYLAREAFLLPHGFAVIDWHAARYDALLDYFARLSPRRPLYLLDPSRGRYIPPYNPFAQQEGNLGATAAKDVDATVKAWAE